LSGQPVWERFPFPKAQAGFKNRNSCLITRDLIENTFNNGLGGRENFKITNKAKKEFLAELNIKNRRNLKDLTASDKITPKQLFYNDAVAGKAARFSALLKPDNFTSVQNNLKSTGMRSGFACLFYGPAGNRKIGSRISDRSGNRPGSDFC
jgi:hypothetical protein